MTYHRHHTLTWLKKPTILYSRTVTLIFERKKNRRICDESINYISSISDEGFFKNKGNRRMNPNLKSDYLISLRIQYLVFKLRMFSTKTAKSKTKHMSFIKSCKNKKITAEKINLIPTLNNCSLHKTLHQSHKLHENPQCSSRYPMEWPAKKQKINSRLPKAYLSGLHLPCLLAIRRARRRRYTLRWCSKRQGTWTRWHTWSEW